jgi:hypothetical protein
MSSECADFNDMVQLDTLIRHIAPTVSNVPNELAVDLLRQYFTDFCRRTEFLTSAEDIIPQKDVTDYEITPPDGYEVHKVHTVSYGSENRTTPTPNYWYPMWGMKFSVIGTKFLVLRDAPSRDSDTPFVVSFVVIPTECVTKIPREISVGYGRHIAKGALSEILLYKNKPWYDPTLSRKMEVDYHRGVQSARNLVLMNRGGTELKARGKRWV